MAHAAASMPKWWMPLLLTIFGAFTLLDGVTAMSFVYRSGNQLYADGKPFYHMGFNGVWMPSSVSFGQTGRVDQTLDAAQNIGLKVVRVWGFNDAFPYAPGKYSDKQGRGLDYVIAAAGQRGIRVELALANFWNAYLSPEAWLTMAYGSVGSKNVADFYRSAKVLTLLEQHVNAIVSRVNTITGVAYKDDPTIIGYNLFNEPRCPGCTPDDMAARNAFIGSLAGTLRAAAPKQLTFSGTEGFFAAGDQHLGFNPGSGSQCEGEDFTKEINLFDVATTHMYWRQMESFKQTGGKRPGFDFYVQYLYRKLKLYTEVASNSGRPLLVEEYGLTKRFFNTEQLKVVVAVIADFLIEAKRAGKPVMGAWIWQAAPIGDPDVGGYDVALTKPLSGVTIGLGSVRLGKGQGASSSSFSEDQVKPGAVITSGATSSAATGSTSSTAAASSGSSGGSSSSSGTSTSTFLTTNPTSTSTPGGTARAVTGRRMLGVGQLVVNPADDSLGSFRRETQRNACAASVQSSYQEQQIPFEVDVQAYLALVSKVDIVDIMAEAADLLK